MNTVDAEKRARVAAVLGPRGGQSSGLAEALVAIDPNVAMFEDSESALGADDPGARLWVFDQGTANSTAVAFAKGLRKAGGDRASAEVLLLLAADPADSTLAAELSDLTYYMTRPFSTAALTAVCRQILGRRAGGSRAGDQSPEAVRARRPTRFEPNRVYEDARLYADELLGAARAGQALPLDAGRPIAERLYTDLLQSNTLVVKALEPHQPYDLASHSANVAIIAGKIAMGLALGPEDSVEVIHASLVHDLGMACLPPALIRQDGHYSDEEIEELRQHPLLGAALIEKEGPRYEWLEKVVLQEHERARGQGYPRGLPGTAIDPFAEIVGIADVFEALSHPRTYRSPYTAFDALEQVAGMQDEYFSARVVTALVNEISSFPLDSFVQLSTGEIARVSATNPSNLMRPVVVVQWDSAWTPLEKPRTLDLLEEPSVTVARSLLESELPIN